MNVIQTIDNKVIDNTETLLIMALQSNKDVYRGDQTHSVNINGGLVEVIDTGDAIGMDKMEMRSAYTFDPVDDERLFSADKDLLMCHPSEIINDEAECIMIYGDVMKWTGIRRVKKNKQVSCLGKASHWYELHFREKNINGSEIYSRRILAVSGKGNILPCVFRGSFIGGSKDAEALILSLSIQEDAKRSNAMLAQIGTPDKQIKFPVPISDYKKVFIDRDGPYSSGRKRSIIHKVMEHSRKLKDCKIINIPSYTRGIQKFSMDGLDVEISPNT